MFVIKSSINLAEKILVKAHSEQMYIVVSRGSQCQAAHGKVSHLHSQQEQADTNIFIHAAEETFTASGA